MKVCFLILAHEHTELCARLVRRLLAAEALVALHLDAKASPGFRQALASNLGEAFDDILWADPVAVGWGEWSMVEATLNGLQAITDAGLDPDYVYLISGADYPIRPLGQLYDYLQRNPGKEFIESVDADGEAWVKSGAQQERYEYRHWISWKKHPRLHNLSTSLQKRLGLKRKFPAGLRPHMGSQWWTLSWETCRGILREAGEPGIRDFFRRTWVADELFFQTLVRKVVDDPTRILNRKLTLVQFSEYGSPLVYCNGHEDYLSGQPFFFARKISPQAQLLRDTLDSAVNDPGDGPPPSDAAVGVVPGDYERFLEIHRHGIKGHRSMCRVGDASLGDLEWNTLPYFVLVSDSKEALAAAQAAFNARDGLMCHGELFAEGRIEFAGDIDRFAGYSIEDLGIRDQKPHNFFVDLLQNQPGLYCGYVLLQKGTEQSKAQAFMSDAHGRDPNATIIELTPGEPGLQAALNLAMKQIPAHRAAAARLANLPGLFDQLGRQEPP